MLKAGLILLSCRDQSIGNNYLGQSAEFSTRSEKGLFKGNSLKKKRKVKKGSDIVVVPAFCGSKCTCLIQAAAARPRSLAYVSGTS